ncbi:GNAT family N-acetyltransferase [Danxiaibacter flavus]|uniref:GNAT family N-acetyltransferase n=1 Tax=Danxiaibacter flavus TaxID=3049108 RepID=A0ABV3ZII9_9BACT|nr:GNAT family N-acetyltransferase [Chitinophagaceae bacterium DXS]
MENIKQDAIKIVPYNSSYRKQLISVWEESVRATHNFLAASDIDYYKDIVAAIDFSAFPVFCLEQNETVIGFIGVADKKIEMLFLSPNAIGQGLGKKLMRYAIEELKADKVDVNEQNNHAVLFYKKSGFITFERSEKDSEGKDYPILKMILPQN